MNAIAKMALVISQEAHRRFAQQRARFRDSAGFLPAAGHGHSDRTPVFLAANHEDYTATSVADALAVKGKEPGQHPSWP